jgi:hypothetical protein
MAAMVADGAGVSGGGVTAGSSRGPLGGGMTAFSAAALQKSRSLHSQSAARMAEATGAYFPSLAHGSSSSPSSAAAAGQAPTQAQMQAMAAAYAAAYSQPMPVPPQRDPHTAHAYAAPANPYASAVEFARAGIRAAKSANANGAGGFGVTITSPQIAVPPPTESGGGSTGVARGRLSTKLAFKQARSRFARAAWDDALTPDLGTSRLSACPVAHSHAVHRLC